MVPVGGLVSPIVFAAEVIVACVVGVPFVDIADAGFAVVAGIFPPVV